MKNTNYQKNGFAVMLLSFCLLCVLTCLVSCENTSIDEIENYVTNNVEKGISKEVGENTSSKLGKSMSNGCRYNDSLALVAIHNATDGSNWTNVWNLNQPIDTWYGVILDANGCVKNLSLVNNGLNGNLIAPVQGLLSKLRVLNLSNNSISGSIPPEVQHLSDLRVLRASNNQLTGSIPLELGNLNNLRELRLDRNQLDGSIPDVLGSMSNLTRLKLYNNQLEGCYGLNLVNLCKQLDPAFNNNASISNGNNFAQAWEKICIDGISDCANEIVVPGDFNKNGYADNIDILHWGMALGNTGPIRPNATSSWIAQDCTPWAIEVAGVNACHQDGDGNGIVDTQDFQVLMDNYGATKYVANPLNLPNPTVDFEFTYQDVELDNGKQQRTYTIYAKDENGDAADIHGAAFNIEFGVDIDSVEVNVIGSSLEPTITIGERIDNSIEIGLTRTDRTNRLCVGPIVQVSIVATKNLPTGPETNLVEGYTINENSDILGIAGMVLIPM